MLKQIQTIIETNNGLIPSSELATLINRNHSDVTKKITAQFDESTLRNILTAQETYNNNNTRTVYMLPEKEAMAIAMSYSVQLGMQVYEAYQAYKAALQDVLAAETVEQAVDTACAVLYTPEQAAIIKAIRERKALGKLVNKLFDTHEDPLVAWNEFYECYKMIGRVMSKENACTYRRKVSDALRREVVSHNTGLRARYRKRAKFDIYMYQKFDAVEAEVLSIQSELRVRDKNKVSKKNVVLKDVIKATAKNPEFRRELINVLQAA
ncbi:hypothetical protein Q9X96_003123 [Vibrio vulnificus]|nr:hypothetical protein [Vibrio vulnificus]